MSSRPSRGAARLAAILDALPDALLLVNCNGTIVNANHHALESFEAPGTALVGRGLLDLLPSFDPNRIPGSMRRPDETQGDGSKPTRMMARRTDGAQFPVQVTSANLEDGRTPYADQYSYTGDELLMLIVRDLTGTLDTEAELARQQRQTEMILRAAAEGVVGVDTEGKVVLVNPSAAQILGYRASDMGGQELHSLVHHSRPDGSPFPYEESPLADTLRSGRKHRVRGQVLWAKDGSQVPVDLTTAPVRDGDQFVGAVLTFTDRRAEKAMAAKHAEEVESLTSRHTEKVEGLTTQHAEKVESLTTQHTKALEELRTRLTEERARYAAQLESVTARNSQLLAVLDESLRGPLLQLRHELGVLADDPAGQLWPEANQILHHLAAGYTRMTTLVDNVLSYQRLDSSGEELARRTVSMDEVVSASVEGAVELIGPGRAQFAVHAPPIDAEVDAERLAQALAHLIADVAGVDSTGNAASGVAASDSTIVVAAAQRGDVVRIEVRGPYAGGDPVHEPIVRGIVRLHGGVLQTHEMPGMGGHAYVLEVPISAAAAAEQGRMDGDAAGQGDGTQGQGTSGTGAGTGADTGTGTGAGTGTGTGAGTAGGNASGQTPTGRRARHGAASSDTPGDTSGGGTQGNGTQGSGAHGNGTQGGGTQGGGTQGGTPPPNLRKADPRTADPRKVDPRTAAQQGAPGTAPGAPAPAALPAVVGENAAAQQQNAAEPENPPRPTGRRRARPHPDEDPAAAAAANPGQNAEGAATGSHRHARGGAPEAAGPQSTGPAAMGVVPPQGIPAQQQPQGRRARRGAPAQEQGGPQTAGAPAPARGAGGRPALALPAAPSDTPQPQAQGPQPAASGMPALPAARTPEEQQPNWGQDTNGGQPQEVPPTGRRRARRALGEAPEQPTPDQAQAQAPGQPQPQQSQPQPAGDPGLVRSPFALPPAAADRAQPGALPPELGPAGLVPAQHGPREARGGGPQPQQGGGLAVRGEPVPPNGAARPGGWPSDPAQGQGQGQDPRRPQPQAQGPQPAASGMPALPAARTPEEQQPNWGQDTNSGQPQEVPPTGRRRARRALGEAPEQPTPDEAQAQGGPQPAETSGRPPAQQPAQPPAQWPDAPAQPRPQPLPAEAPPSADTTQGRAISVRTLGQGVPFAQQVGEQPQGQPAQGQPQGRPPQGQPQTPSGGTSTSGGRRRKLAARPEMTGQGASAELQPAGNRAHPHTGPQPHTGQSTQGGQQPHTGPQPHPGPQTGAQPRPQPGPGAQPQRAVGPSQGSGRTFAIGAPDEGAEGPEPLDGPNGAVEIVDDRTPPPDDELPPEPLDNPRRLLVWPAPDMSTQQALSDRGYRPVIVNSREEVDAQIAAYPAALFVDPLTGPITRTALQSLRTAAVAAEVPVLVTAGLGQATREAAYGADPAVLLKALAPRDSEQHPSRVLLIEEHEPIAMALTATLERRGMQVARAATDADAVSLAAQMRPNLVVMDLMQVRRRRAGIVDWLRGNGLLNRTPLVVYTSADIDPANLSRLASGETVLFLAERSTSAEVQSRIVDLLAKIGTN